MDKGISIFFFFRRACLLSRGGGVDVATLLNHIRFYEILFLKITWPNSTEFSPKKHHWIKEI